MNDELFSLKAENVLLKKQIEPLYEYYVKVFKQNNMKPKMKTIIDYAMKRMKLCDELEKKMARITDLVDDDVLMKI